MFAGGYYSSGRKGNGQITGKMTCALLPSWVIMSNLTCENPLGYQPHVCHTGWFFGNALRWLS